MTSNQEQLEQKYSNMSYCLHWYHWAVVILSLALTLGAFYISERQVMLKGAAQFDFQSQQIVDLVEERMKKYEEALWAGVAALNMFPTEATRTDWKIFGDKLNIDERFPGINGIGVIYYVPKEKLDAYLSWQRKIMPNYSIHPKHSQDEYWPITYIEPESSNLKAIGLDMAHEVNRYTAAKQARNESLTMITGPITLVQDETKTPGFLFYAPWYSLTKNDNPLYGEPDGKFNGLVYAPFIMHKLMDGTLENTNRLVNFSIHDKDTLLYTELENGSNYLTNEPLFSKKISLDLYGRNWTFNIHSSKLFNEQQNHTQPYIILFGGLVIDSLLLAIFIILTKSNKKAIIYAQEVTYDIKKEKEKVENISENLKRRNQELEEANNELDQFAFIASHDLKAPLRGINQLASWIEEDSEGNLNPETYSHLTLLKSRVSRLEKLLNDLLSYSRAGRKENKIEKVNIEGLINHIFKLFDHENKFLLSLKSEIPKEEVNTMPTPLELVLRNLISNSIKHHDKEYGNILVTVTPKEDYLQFSVSDDGPGIPKEHTEKIFELFHTLKPRDQVEGSGLGLSIIKKVLERYECSYEVISEENVGTTFSFSWPIGDTIGKENYENRTL